MQTPLIKIKELITFLNSKDYSLAKTFIENRDFENLRDLVSSAVIIEERTQSKLDVITDLDKVRLYNLNELLAEVKDYCNLLGIDDDIKYCYNEDY